MARRVPSLRGGSEAALLELARRGDRGAFEHVTGRYVRELHLHCYRMLGSLHDADDVLQETLLRAWRAIGRFESRASVRTWLYRIATNACLNALAERPRRSLPSGLIPASDPDDPPREPILEPIWLEPYPDRLLEELEDPAAWYARRETVELAFLVAIQLLPPRQRAVLLLRDVVELSANEVAALLGTSRASVNSALQRARNRLGHRTLADAAPSEPTQEERALLERYMGAFARADMKELARVLAEDVEMTMPPDPTWFRGRQDVIRFLERGVFAVRGQIVLEPTGANRQPAVALYERATEGDRGLSVQVLTVVGGVVGGITGFVDQNLFPPFGLRAERAR